MTMTEAPAHDGIEYILEECGVTQATLSALEKDALDRDGYVVLANIIDAWWLEQLREHFENACGSDRESSNKETGTRHANLVNQHPVFDRVYLHPRVLAAVHHVLRCAFRVGQMGGRDPLPGFGQQGLHADWVARHRNEPFRIVTAIWLLDDFTANNGATRLVPGTHLLLTPPSKSFADPASRHPEQKIIIARSGSVLVFNGHLWHSGTRNDSINSRRVIQCSFVGRNETRFTRIQVAAPDRLTAPARYLLGM